MLIADARIRMVRDFISDIHNLLYSMHGPVSLAINIIFMLYILGLLCPQIHYQICHIHQYCVFNHSLQFS